VIQSDWRYETISVAAAAAIESGTGLVLISFPSLLDRLLSGVELSEPGRVVGRLAGFTLLALTLACWPVGGAGRSALLALLVFSALATVYLFYVGLGGVLAGPLLWPAVALHGVLTILFVRCCIDRS
jgi:hypothetical protein